MNRGFFRPFQAGLPAFSWLNRESSLRLLWLRSYPIPAGSNLHKQEQANKKEVLQSEEFFPFSCTCSQATSVSGKTALLPWANILGFLRKMLAATLQAGIRCVHEEMISKTEGVE